MKIITMKNLLQNPSGTQSSYFARRDLIISNLEDRYLSLIKTKNINVDIYKDKGDIFFRLIVPSEKFTENLTYDVILQFIPVGGATGEMTINNYAIKMFSNSPNFMFTYAYVFNKDGVLVDFTKSKLSKQCLTDEPKVKNPLQSYGFEKSVYFSLLYLKEKRLLYKSSIANAKSLKVKELLKDIKTSEDKLKEYNILDAKEKEEKRKEREKEKKKKEAEQKKVVQSRTKTTRTTVTERKSSNKTKKEKKSHFKVKKPIRSTLKRR